MNSINNFTDISITVDIYLNVIFLNIKIYLDKFECKSQYLKLKKTYVTMQIKSFCTFALFSFFYLNEENKCL